MSRYKNDESVSAHDETGPDHSPEPKPTGRLAAWLQAERRHLLLAGNVYRVKAQQHSLADDNKESSEQTVPARRANSIRHIIDDKNGTDV